MLPGWESKQEIGVETIPCASGWCGKIVLRVKMQLDDIDNSSYDTLLSPQIRVIALIRSHRVSQRTALCALYFSEDTWQSWHTQYGVATQRICLQRGPSDSEDRCAYTKWNYKRVLMCFCRGDLCNNSGIISVHYLFIFTIAGLSTFSYFFCNKNLYGNK
ncbi:hypothetical protein NQ317_006206 [Molorchus minor]|uniref:Protein quiver n=1 Tax=Molorchus minor TaxID=1323400 RepID=A0ABQ9ITJ8_9CUCU|nr:hypothetical protein NQ317_006206 [Molorchus minor]